jgi:alkanesulfonate monooxygenase SsuD/methylene tetrahydromethanopterin reductase-like flavin-dependent oxidoreductase (luciferase family)
MRPLKIGLVLGLYEDVATGRAPTWNEIKSQALFAEQVGFDTVWLPDELLWEPESWPGPRGWWECIAMTGAVAEATTEVTIGTWVLSALHRNPALTAKAVSTLDEISAGRILFGFGAGHSAGQGAAFGYPPDKVVGRYEEALEIVVPLLRGESVDFEGEYHRARLTNRPTGPRPATIPIMLGGHGPRTIALAVRHGDVWSAYPTKGSGPDSFAEMIELVDRTCEEQGRDPGTLGKSIGVEVVPEGFEAPTEWGVTDPLSGPPAAIAEKIQEFADLGVTSLELWVWPGGQAAYEAAAAVLQQFEE